MPDAARFTVDYDPELVEETVLRCIAGHPREGEFRRMRNRLYEIADSDGRDAAFRECHAGWFAQLGLDRTVQQTLDERPALVASTDRCAVVRAQSRKAEGAELYVSPPGDTPSEATGRAIVMTLSPGTLLDADGVLALLRHELQHVADMLDPCFAYEPVLPCSEWGPLHEQLVQDRYRVLWDTSIDGRLVRIGWAPPVSRERRWREFAAAFPMLGEHAAEAFDRFFNDPSPTHAALVRCASNPAAVFALPCHRVEDGARCPLCGFPTYMAEPTPENLPLEVAQRIVTDFPTWAPSDGLCLQCADLYRASLLSCAAAASIPG